MLSNMKILITGGAGFIGSNVVEKLVADNEITVIDNLSNVPDDRYIRDFRKKKSFSFLKKDLADPETFKDLPKFDVILHLAAHSDVRGGYEHPEIDFRQNIEVTRNLLEFIRQKGIKELMFSSTSAVYGEASVIPTPETYGPCKPISSYGATKLADEALIFAYSSYYHFRASVFRFANVVGKNSTHGAIYDFIKKLKENPKKLDVLGDGAQAKSYIHVSDCVNAILFVHSLSKVTDLFNLGNTGVTSVKKIADIVVKELGLKDVNVNFTGGYEGRGWVGDVKLAELDTAKTARLGWKNEHSSDDAVKTAAHEIMTQVRIDKSLI
ncbi:NAD-dependent epimerase/dehydratase family protein [Candidatus Parvarchaeota archaeon]|nr:NAD-dependent epimerase/dehydratase family protein [Candidatus Parvarchaeota archaeon]